MNKEENAEIRNRIQTVIILVDMIIENKRIPVKYLKLVQLDLQNLIIFLNTTI